MTTIKIPQKAIPILIGKSGSNVKRIERDSGARVRIDSKRCEVVISGYPESNVNRAVQLVNTQLESIRSQATSSFEHPVIVVTQLSSDFSDKCRFLPHPSGKYQLFAVNKSPTKGVKSIDEPKTNSKDESVSFLEHAVAFLSMNKDRVFFSDSEAHLIHPQFLGQALLIETPKMKASKVRFNVGKQLFYNAPKSAKPLPVGVDLKVSFLSTLRVGHEKDLKMEFNNIVSEATVKLLLIILKGLEFKMVEEKETLSCHFIDLDKRTGVQSRFVLKQGEGSECKDIETLELALVKSATHRRCFVSCVNDHTDTRDFRLKLLAHSQDVSAESALREQHSRVEWNRALRKVTLKSTTSTTSSLTQRFEVEKARRKSKKIHEGKFQDQTFRVSIITIQDDEGTHYEVAGTCPNWNKDLKNMEYYHKTFAFCNHLTNAEP